MSNWVDHVRFGTEAHHRLGDISREDGVYFIIDRETEDDYIGRWLEGFGFVEVRFPKHTTRALTDEEREDLNGSEVVIV